MKGKTVSLLSGISCMSAARCLAVGYSSKGVNFATLAEMWNGKARKIMATPTSAGASFGAVSCKAGVCEAVGNGTAARWNGKRWSKLQKLANPGGNTPASLGSVSCTVKHTCYASGCYYLDAVQTSVVEYFNGTRWVVQNAPITASNDSSGFGGVSCPTPTRCTLVGFYHDPDNGNQALAMDFALRWQDVSPVPVVSVNGSLGSVSYWSPQVTDLNGVSCPARLDCLAVGSIVRNGAEATLAERWNGIAWTIQATPSPAGSHRSFLLGVSCTSKSACTAVGFGTRAGHQLTLAERWNGKTWAVQGLQRPILGSLAFGLNSVWCNSPIACMSVGSYVNTSATQFIFAEQYS